MVIKCVVCVRKARMINVNCTASCSHLSIIGVLIYYVNTFIVPFYSIVNALKLSYFGIRIFPFLARKTLFPRFFFKIFPSPWPNENGTRFVRNLLSLYACFKTLTPRIHAPVLSPLIRNGLLESSLAFLLRSPSISPLFHPRTFRCKMGLKKKKLRAPRLFGGYREKYLKKYLRGLWN